MVGHTWPAAHKFQNQFFVHFYLFAKISNVFLNNYLKCLNLFLVRFLHLISFVNLKNKIWHACLAKNKDNELCQPYNSNVFQKTSHYIRTGLPRAQKRFEAVLAQTQSVPNSAINSCPTRSNSKVFGETEFENNKNSRLTSVSLTQQLPYLHGSFLFLCLNKNNVLNKLAKLV